MISQFSSFAVVHAVAMHKIFSPVKILQPLDTAYTLIKHRDGRWEWSRAPGVAPSPRYQHAAVCFLWHLRY